jgi:hypothetical protein
MQGIVGNNPCPVLLATYTPSMEINVSREGIPDAAKEMFLSVVRATV